ncbi:MAG: phosphorylase [Gammaproteobacteria bacterium]|nr:phosphorylase [Gammaproteobacteria bacterium]
MKRIGIVTALAAEAACLIRPPPPDSPQTLDECFSMVLCGSGPHRAARGAELLLAAGAEALISFGVAGALSHAVRPGQLLVPHTVISSVRRFEATANWRLRVLARLSDGSVRAHEGVLTASEGIVAGVPAKAELHRATGADAVDMESAAILEVAERRGVPALVLRVVLDAADLEIPDPVIRRSDAYGRARRLPLLADLVRRPSSVPAMVRLAGGFRAATGTLRWLGRNRARILPFGSPP